LEQLCVICRSRLCSKEERISGDDPIRLKRAVFLLDGGCSGGRALQRILMVVSAGQLVFAGCLGDCRARPGKTRNHCGTEQSSRTWIPRSGADSVVAKIPRRYNPAERREILLPVCLSVSAVSKRGGSSGWFVI
jgi:hypothetical protein